ncbi:hypothetical protein HA402_011942 [Bradysia odoriphaga]|nr:hypothetical protein HA402_011942 [Bradysia odoriphaga]
MGMEIIGCADANLVGRISRLKETRNDDGYENDFDVPLEFTSNKDSFENEYIANFEETPQKAKRVKLKRKLHNRMHDDNISFHHDRKSEKLNQLTGTDGDIVAQTETTYADHSKNHNNINGKRITFKKEPRNRISILTERQHKLKEGKLDGKKSDTLKRKRKHRKKKPSSLPPHNTPWLGSASDISITSIHKIPLITSMDDANQKSIMGLVDNAAERSDVTEFMSVGDLSCLDNDFIPAPNIPNADIKYIRNDTPDNKSAFIEAQYICHDGYIVDFNQMRATKSNVFCRNGEWLGELPKCIRSADTNRVCQQAQICEHICHVDNAGLEYCTCYKGFRMRNDRCVDECADRTVMEKLNIQCRDGCENTPGSYRCLENFEFDIRLNDDDEPTEDEDIQNVFCPDGFEYNTTTRGCTDVDECAGKVNGGCYDQCKNTVGSFHCYCKVGFILAEDKYTCITLNITSDVTCPPLFPPHHGYLECTQPTSYTSGKNQITNSPGSQCILICPNGYRMSGSFAKTCGMNGKWIGADDGECIKYPTPRLICPSDVIYETLPNKSFAVIKVLKPKTDVNWDRDIVTNPIWVKNGAFELGVGVLHINYTATHPISHISLSCDFTVTVLAGEPPTTHSCPPTQSITLANHEDRVKVNWEEPLFKDNVNVTHVAHTDISGTYFGVGSHQITYTATDFAGYKTKCVFEVSINVPEHHHTNNRQYKNHPFLPIYDFF